MNTNPQQPTFTIFIPTYNRAHTLPRALKSIEDQTFRDFEVVIVDDGSTDGTRELIADWKARVDFEVQYHWQQNQGKPAAHNLGIQVARGEFFVLLDSDDALVPECLRILKEEWESIPDDERHNFAGIEGLCADKNGQHTGSKFPMDVFDSNYLEITRKYGVYGDKKNAIKTAILRKFPYPRIAGEKHIRDSIIWERMAHRYKFRYINKVLQIVEQHADGLTRNIFRLRMQNRRSFQYYWQESISLHTDHLDRKGLVRNYTQFVRYSLHVGIGYREQAKRVKSLQPWMMALPRGTLEWIADLIKKRLRKVAV